MYEIKKELKDNIIEILQKHGMDDEDFAEAMAEILLTQTPKVMHTLRDSMFDELKSHHKIGL